MFVSSYNNKYHTQVQLVIPLNVFLQICYNTECQIITSTCYKANLHTTTVHTYAKCTLFCYNTIGVLFISFIIPVVTLDVTSLQLLQYGIVYHNGSYSFIMYECTLICYHTSDLKSYMSVL